MSSCRTSLSNIIIINKTNKSQFKTHYFSRYIHFTLDKSRYILYIFYKNYIEFKKTFDISEFIRNNQLIAV